MSAEPNRKAPYSSDMRWRIIIMAKILYGFDISPDSSESQHIGTVHNVL